MIYISAKLIAVLLYFQSQKLSNFSQIYANNFLELLLRARAWGSKYFGTTLKYLDRESKYLEVVGPYGGPVVSEGVQILQHYSEVIGPGGTISGGSIFFVTKPVRFSPRLRGPQQMTVPR